MTITLYKVSCAPNTVDKTDFLSDAYTLSQCRPNEPCDILSPSIVLSYVANLETYNYVYIPEFHRHYFITGISLLSGKRAVINCGVDVLHTYHTAIKNCSGTVLRSESIGKPTMIADSKLPIHTNERTIDAINFPDTPFTREVGSHFILTTIGGTPTQGGTT